MRLRRETVTLRSVLNDVWLLSSFEGPNYHSDYIREMGNKPQLSIDREIEEFHEDKSSGEI